MEANILWTRVFVVAFGFVLVDFGFVFPPSFVMTLLLVLVLSLVRILGSLDVIFLLNVLMAFIFETPVRKGCDKMSLNFGRVACCPPNFRP